MCSFNKTFSYLSSPGTSTSSSAATVIPDPRLFGRRLGSLTTGEEWILPHFPVSCLKIHTCGRDTSLVLRVVLLSRAYYSHQVGVIKKIFIPRWGSSHFTRGLTESAGLKHIPRTCFLGLTPPHHFFFGLNLDSSLVLFLHSTSKLVSMLDPSLVLFLHSTSKLGLPLSPTFQMTLHQYLHKLPRTVQFTLPQYPHQIPCIGYLLVLHRHPPKFHD